MPEKHPCIICEKNRSSHLHAGLCEPCYTILFANPDKINMLIQYYRAVLVNKKIVHNLHSFGGLDGLLKYVCDIIHIYFDYNRSSIYIYDYNTNTLNCRYVSGLSKENYLDKPGIPVKKEIDKIDTASVSVNCFLTQKLIIITDRSADPEYKKYLQEKELGQKPTERSKSFAMIPIKTQDRILGVLGVFRLDSENYYPISENELTTITILLEQAAIAIQNIFVLEKQREIQKDFAGFITNLLEKDEEFSPGHHQRVAELSQEIAEAMGLPSEQVHIVFMSAFAHDYGKTDYTRLVLIPGPLTKKEKKELEDHTIQNGKLFVSAGVLRDKILPLIYQHHEWWNGGGYPYKLKGEAIALGARIICAADAYDAMVSDRPYRKGMSQDDAIKELKKNAGTQFDPQVIDAFVKTYEDKKKVVSL